EKSRGNVLAVESAGPLGSMKPALVAFAQTTATRRTPSHARLECTNKSRRALVERADARQTHRFTARRQPRSTALGSAIQRCPPHNLSGDARRRLEFLDGKRLGRTGLPSPGL